MDPRFAHVTDWIFDLDNCLYPASTELFALIDERMGAYIQRLLRCDPVEARRVQKAHFHAHGTTLAGLMAEHGVDPHEFLEDVHAIPLDRVSPDARLAKGLGRLPGRKFVFTNGDAPYATRVLQAIGVHEHFEDLHDIHAGMTTVWVDNGSERGNHDYDSAIVDLRITDVGEWLHDMLGEQG